MQSAISTVKHLANSLAAPHSFIDAHDDHIPLNSGNGRELKFPPDFVWGTATASYQVEGGCDAGGRGLSIWDTFSRERCVDNGDVACGHFFKYEEDVKLMQQLGFKNYRLSISWSRIQPTGRGPINAEGVAFYNDLINCLLAHGVEPLITLYHWDLPQALEDELGGWQNREIAPTFCDYARLCFELFGDRVKNWLTFNEPWCVCLLGYGTGEHAPGITCDDGSKVYMAAHNVLRAHAAAVDIYRREYKAQQGGVIGITLNCNWNEPVPDKDPAAAQRNADAAHRILMWSLGWFADPIWRGEYPPEMRQRCGDRLPAFTDEEKALLKGSSDFLGLNHYFSDFVKDSTKGEFVSHWGITSKGGYFGDMAATTEGHHTWSQTDMGWNVVPWGFKELLLWCQERYNPPGGIYITENGCAVPEPTKESSVKDCFRVAYLTSYIAAMHEAMEAGADVRGYFAWSFLDNFEWSLGYSKRFGIVHVDYDTLARTPKASAHWFARVTAHNAVHIRDGAKFTDAATRHCVAKAVAAAAAIAAAPFAMPSISAAASTRLAA
ncbi:beta-glucosidase, family GH1 [Tribonema minus]|uniref:beta-glucosidase n=1 Tax=Tribonema minus TaxID=303371 RepID=A0A835YNG2_9STRA|nr:beta-glucosidase, family GH1 [Tribonema minus]